METNTTPSQEPTGRPERSSVAEQPTDFQRFMRSQTAGILIAAFITLVLLIPLVRISFLITERKQRQQQVAWEFESEWGGKVSYYGLLMEVPVTKIVSESTGSGENLKTIQKTVARKMNVYPEKSTDKIFSSVSEKKRGIFASQVFNARIQSASVFNLARVNSVNPGEKIDWTKARMLIVTNDGSRITELADITVNGKKYAMETDGSGSFPAHFQALATPVSIDPLSAPVLTASATLSLNGTGDLTYRPYANESVLHMTSNWNDPAFSGTSLPDGNSLKINEKGFSGNWKTLNIMNKKGALHNENMQPNRNNYTQIRFLEMVDHYQLNERTVKYGALVLVLTFAVFFLVQLVGKITVHPFHYFMIGLSLLLFYTLLLAFSEQTGFIPAYIISSAVIITMIIWYAKSILRSARFAFTIGLSLTLLYTFLLVIVNLETYALIVGSIGLTIVLAAIMSFTRRLNFSN